MILLNPGPANTTDAVKRAMTKPDICPREREFGDVMMRVRDGLTRVVHQGESFTTVLFVGSGTAAVEATVSSVVPTDGRLLVVDNGSYGARIARIAASYGIARDVLTLGVGVYPEPARVAAALDGGRYSHLALIHHETSTGILNPAAEIGALCRERGVEMIVDAMSSYGGIPIDVEAMGADFLISSSNKCIQGMAGIGFVICRKMRLDEMEPIEGRGFYLNLARQHRFFEQQRQMQFTPPVQVVYALEQALDEYFVEGGENRAARYRANWEALDSGMRELGFTRLLDEAVSSRILTSYIEPDHAAYDFERMHDLLYRKGFTIYPGKGADKRTFRLANMGHVHPDDMRHFVRAMEETIAEMEILPLYST